MTGASPARPTGRVGQRCRHRAASPGTRSVRARRPPPGGPRRSTAPAAPPISRRDEPFTDRLCPRGDHQAWLEFGRSLLEAALIRWGRPMRGERSSRHRTALDRQPPHSGSEDLLNADHVIDASPAARPPPPPPILRHRFFPESSAAARGGAPSTRSLQGRSWWPPAAPSRSAGGMRRRDRAAARRWRASTPPHPRRLSPTAPARRPHRPAVFPSPRRRRCGRRGFT